VLAIQLVDFPKVVGDTYDKLSITMILKQDLHSLFSVKATYCPPAQSRRESYEILPACNVQAENIGNYFRSALTVAAGNLKLNVSLNEH
jgi:hypothetical protein